MNTLGLDSTSVAADISIAFWGSGTHGELFSEKKKETLVKPPIFLDGKLNIQFFLSPICCLLFFSCVPVPPHFMRSFSPDFRAGSRSRVPPFYLTMRKAWDGREDLNPSSSRPHCDLTGNHGFYRGNHPQMALIQVGEIL